MAMPTPIFLSLVSIAVQADPSVFETRVAYLVTTYHTRYEQTARELADNRYHARRECVFNCAISEYDSTWGHDSGGYCESYCTIDDESVRECYSKCASPKYDHDQNWDCASYCHYVAKSDLSTVSALILVLVFAIAFGSIAMVSSRLLEIPRNLALLSACGAAVVVVLAGVLPSSTEHPLYCAEVSWVSEIGLQIYPVTFLGSSGSFVAMAVGVAWLASKPRTTLATISTVYLLLVTVCNACGLIGILHMSCHQEHLFGLPFYIGWLISSFITNLVLQKIVVKRAALVDESRLPKALNCIFIVEVVLASLLFALSMFVAISVSTTDYEERDREQDQLTDEERREREEAGRNAVHLIAIAIILFTLLFVMFDLLFSFASSMAMRRGLVKIQKQMPSSATRSENAQPTGGLLQWPDELSRSVFFAKVNLGLVVASVATTTIFYVSFIVMTAVLTSELNEDELHRRVAFLFIAWLLDSLFNDVCVVFVGFGPTAKSLATVGAAAGADIIGAPYVAAPVHQIVDGMAVGTPVTSSVPAHNVPANAAKGQDEGAEGINEKATATLCKAQIGRSGE